MATPRFERIGPEAPNALQLHTLYFCNHKDGLTQDDKRGVFCTFKSPEDREYTDKKKMMETRTLFPYTLTTLKEGMTVTIARNYS